MRPAVSLAVAFALVLALAGPASAADGPPRVLSHHGRLLDGSDHPVNAGVDFEFSLHPTDNPNRNEPVWVEPHPGLAVVDGFYSTVLGDPAKGGVAFPADLLEKDELYLGIKIGGVELLPRQRLSSTVYALRAGRAVLAETVAPAAVNTDALADGAVTLAKLARTNGKMAGLDSDLLDGLDSSAFAPAAIETKIDAIQASVGAGLGSDVSGVKTDVGGVKTDLAGVKTDVGGVKTDVAAVLSKVTDLGARLGDPGSSTVAADAAAAKGQSATALARIGDPGTNTLTGLLTTQGTTLGTVNTTIGTMNTSVNSMTASVAAMSGAIGSASASGSLVARVAALEAAVGAMSYGLVPGNPGTSCLDIQLKSAARGSGLFWIDPDGTGPNPAVQTPCDLGVQGLSCLDIKNRGRSTGDGVYIVDPDGVGGQGAFQVYCDMTTDGGGWTFFGHFNGDSGGTGFFTGNLGNYRTDRTDDNTTYTRAGYILPYVSHTSMMVTLDTADVNVARGANKTLFFQYSQGATAFNTGPVPCSGLSGYSYRTQLTGAFSGGGTTNSCDSGSWYARTAGSAAYLTLFNSGGLGNYWGSGMGGNDSWNHDGWWYVR